MEGVKGTSLAGMYVDVPEKNCIFATSLSPH